MTNAIQQAPRRTPSPHELSWLAEELPAWTHDGLLTDDQARRIRARYDFAAIELDRRAGPGRVIQVLSILGAVLVGAGILTWVAANWDGMSDAFRLALIFGGVIGFNAGGYELAFRRKNHPHLGQALLFLGSASYGAGIFLVAQIFHLSGHWPNAFLAWGLGALGVAVAVEALPVFTLAAAALTIWGCGEAAEFKAMGLASFAVVAVLLAIAYVRRSRGHLVVGVLALAAWFAVVPAGLLQKGELAPVAWLAASGALVAAGVVHRSLGREDLAAPWRMVGTGGGMFALFILSIRPVAFELARSAGTRPAGGAMMPLLVAAAAVCVWALVVAVGRARFEAWAALGVVLLGGAWLLIGNREYEIPIALLFNIALFAASAGLVLLGLHERRAAAAYQGLGWFAVGVLALYVDFGWNLLDKSLFFAVGGVLLLTAGWVLERQRRRIAASIKEGHA
ncbi:MAG: DUF2157 domain-containing protein [Planctomycetes bacterium]|nr:DUF2157 domain-containing protein [Planctomycetota bacterium]